MHDRPTSEELVTAVCHWLENELVPALEDQRLRFQARVALHALRMVERELPREETDLRAELAELSALLDWKPAVPASLGELRATVREGNRQLCERIRTGQYDRQPQFGALLRQLRPLVRRKLEVSQGR